MEEEETSILLTREGVDEECVFSSSSYNLDGFILRREKLML